MTDLGYTNAAMITLFEQELHSYEVSVNANSRIIANYKYPSSLIKQPLERLVNTKGADAYSMMKILAEHVSLQKDDAYSEYSLTMLASATFNENVKQLIMNVVYVTRVIVTGQVFDFNDSWFRLVNTNDAIKTFLKAYTSVESDIANAKVTAPDKTLTKVSSSTDEFVLAIGLANYQIKFTSNTVQSLSFQIDSQYASGNIPAIVSTNAIVTPNINRLIIDKYVGIYDDVIAQLLALNCTPQGYTSGTDTLITLPGLFYALALNVVSIDHGQTWKISEVSILPPSVSRSL